MSSRQRSLWVVVAVGAAVAWAAFALGAADRNAAASNALVDSTWVPITPCRLFDFRSGSDNVGPKRTPLEAGNPHTVQVTGSNGHCSIPTNAVAVSMNVTIVNPDAASYLTLYAADAVQPFVSALNWQAGQKATPNRVDVALSSDGAIKLFNRFGTVNVIGDVSGYWVRSTLTELQQRVSDQQVALDTLVRSRSFTAHSSGDQTLVVSDSIDHTPVRSVALVAPTDGTVTVDYTVTVAEPDAGEGVNCSIVIRLFPIVHVDATHEQSWVSPGAPGGVAQVTGTRTFDVEAGFGDRSSYTLVCAHIGPIASSSELRDSSVSATFNALASG